MKYIFLLVSLFVCQLSIDAQDLIEEDELTQKDVFELNELSVNTQKLDLRNPQVTKDLHQVLRNHKKFRRSRFLAYVFGVYSVVGISLGSIFLNSNGSIVEVLGPAYLVSGVVFAGVTVPLIIGSTKRKKERDRLIEAIKY